MVFTDLGIFEITPAGFLVKELFNGMRIADVQAVTKAQLI
jgi:acyl CoA:acetate/3-ketoacid CoA transferase beta subunit